MFAKHSQVNQTHRDPKRRIQLATLLLKHAAGLTLRDITVKTGLSPASLAVSLGALRAEGSVDVVERDRWRWTGGPLLVGWRDLNARRRRIVEILIEEHGCEISSQEIAEKSGFAREDVTHEIQVLVSAGWATTRMGTLNKRRAVFAAITEAGAEAYVDVMLEISTARQPA